ncbi:hypothetical protein HD597_005162 [Nonomuraea thailandensis]|uniref:Uncharacterized protein n=1 Tax=Nonomuraea thailandensis TaxID=1188745 RepID=A0A9X2GGI1_9ACTN|nr:hypothetical protein [Nonomuraea thailandensis]MCP2358142.1 hypothetical protein [Nonomuraea thailandensis]
MPAEMFGVSNGLGYAVLNARDNLGAELLREREHHGGGERAGPSARDSPRGVARRACRLERHRVRLFTFTRAPSTADQGCGRVIMWRFAPLPT